jgi:hypothetical protein
MIELNLKLGLYNLWIFLVVGYGLIWALMIFANRKRGSTIEDPDFYPVLRQKATSFRAWMKGDSVT